MSGAGPPSPIGGGVALTDGLIYQADVAAWAALQLIIVQGLAQELLIEPASQEDAEAQVTRPDVEFESTAAAGGYRLIIQAKRITTGPWSSADLKSLLDGGSARVPAGTRLLAHPDTRYLLVTSADVNGPRKLLVEDFDEWPSAKGLPRTFQPYASAGRSRFAVLGSADDWTVEHKVTDLLRDVLKVPHDQLEECRTALRGEALLRARAKASGVWSREEIWAVLRAHGAYLSSLPDLDDFVAPRNWDDLVRQARSGAVLITGQSGAGKTLAALKLCDELHATVAGLKQVNVTKGPGEVERQLSARPILFYLEDPWGKYRLSPDSMAWNEELTRMLPRSGAGVHFVVTSRSDVISGAGEIAGRLAPWVVRLDAEQYGPRERLQLFDTRLKRLTPSLRLLALRQRDGALKRLETPLEIERWFIALQRGPAAEENLDDFAERALHQAHHTSFEDTVADELSAREDGAWTPVLWALLKAQPSLDRGLLTQVRRGVASREPRLKSGLEPLLNFLIVGRSLRQVGSLVYYAHPRVEAGFEQAMDRSSELSEDALSAVVETLVSFDDERSDGWGKDAALRVVASGAREGRDKEKASRVFTPTGIVDLLDERLRERLQACSAEDFHETLRLAADAGSARSRVSALARWLLEFPDPDEGWIFRTWRAPPRSDEWYRWIREDVTACVLLDRFVRISLVFERNDYPASLYDDLAPFGCDLDAPFRAAASALLDRGYEGRAQAVVEGALRDLDAAASLAAEAAALQVKLAEEWRNAPRDAALPELNGDHNGDAYDGDDQDWGYVASLVLDAYVPRLRSAKGWATLDASPVATGALSQWKKAIEGDAPSRRSQRELQAFSARARGGAWEDDAVRLGDGGLTLATSRRLSARLSEDDATPAVWSATVRVLAEHQPDIFTALQGEWLARSDLSRVMTLHWCLLTLAGADARAKARHRRLSKWLLRSAPDALREIGEALQSSAAGAWSPQAAQLAETLRPLLPEACVAFARLALRRGVRAAAAVEAGLDGWSRDDASAPAELAELVVEAGWRDLYALLSRHPLALVRRPVLRARWRAGDLSLAEIAVLLPEENSSFVRRMLAEELAVQPTLERLDVLLTLAADTWAHHSTSPGEAAEHPIARMAADAITELTEVPDDRVRAIFKTAVSADDHHVRWLLLTALAARGTDETRRRLESFALNEARKPSLRAAVAEALRIVAEHFGSAGMPAPPAAAILQAPPAVAVALTRWLSQVAETSEIFALAKTLNGSGARRALLLLLNSRNDSTLGRELAALLPEGHAGRRLLRHPHGKTRLARSSVEDLGDIRVVEAVRKALLERFEPERTPPSRPRRRSRSARRAAPRGVMR